MTQVRIFYWNDSKYLHDNIVPTEQNFERDYRLLPYFNVVPIATGEQALNQLFGTYNDDNNPMGTTEMQNWIRDNLLPHRHTSMSVGDIIELDGELWLCKSEGWEKLPFTAATKNKEAEQLASIFLQ